MSYSTSKHALNGLTKVLAVDYASKGVRVNALCPGLTDTGILSVMTDDLREKVCAGIPMMRTADPAEELRKAIRRTREPTDKPFAMNVMTAPIDDAGFSKAMAGVCCETDYE